MSKSEALKAWNKPAREVARPGQCAAIGCKARVLAGKAWCAAHA